MNVEQQRAENRKALDELGGVDTLLKLANVDIHKGLSKAQVEFMRNKFGPNVFPEAPLDSFLSLLLEALSDTTLLILIAAATVSTIINTLQHPDHGWVDGTAIFIAVFLVSNISAANDYSKQLQFRKLEESSQETDRCSVLRDGVIERIHPRDVVIGDVLVLQVIFQMILIVLTIVSFFFICFLVLPIFIYPNIHRRVRWFLRMD